MDAHFLDRHIRAYVVEALTDTRVVVVLGARQVGKSTLVGEIARHEHSAGSLTLDDRATRTAAQRDPTGFIADLTTPVVIDEIQRVPDVLLAIKQRVDLDKRPGQFLLTGSANILTAPRIADALTGRAEYYRLWPFTQGELRGARERFIDRMCTTAWYARSPRRRDGFSARHAGASGAVMLAVPARSALKALMPSDSVLGRSFVVAQRGTRSRTWELDEAGVSHGKGEEYFSGATSST